MTEYAGRASSSAFACSRLETTPAVEARAEYFVPASLEALIKLLQEDNGPECDLGMEDE